jgi:hypothetical protein
MSFINHIKKGEVMRSYIVIATIVVLSASICFGQTYDPNTMSAEKTDPCLQAAIDASMDVNGNLWYGAGCLFGILGMGASYVIEPDPPATRMIGMEANEMAIYTTCYKLEAKKIQQKKSLSGCLTYAAVYVLLIMGASG